MAHSASSGAWFNQALATFAEQVGAGPHKQILLVIDGAGWHIGKDLVIPDGIHLEVLLSYTKSESYNPDSQQADCFGANGVCPAHPGLAKTDSV